MKITNVFNMPEQYTMLAQKQIERSSHERDINKVYPTEISSKGILARTLSIKYGNEVTKDVSDFQALWFGNAWHAYVESVVPPEHPYLKVEVPVKVPFVGKDETYIVSGRIDTINHKTRSIEDHKTGQKWAIILKQGKEYSYALQLNIYRYLYYRLTGELYDNLLINWSIKDWSKKEAIQVVRRMYHLNGTFKTIGSKVVDSLINGDYPPSGLLSIKVPIMEIKEVEKIILEYLSEVHKYRNVHEDEIPECPPEQRFSKPTSYVIKEKGRKKALAATIKGDNDKRRPMTEIEAEETLADKYSDNKDAYVEERKGEDTKCMYYCDVRDYCHYYKKTYVEKNNA